MSVVRSGPATGLIAQLVLLVALYTSVGVSAFGWVVGVGCGVIINAALNYGLGQCAADRLGPADWVTLTRAVLVGGVAALTADSFSRHIAVSSLVILTVVALLLDVVDGWVARRTQTASMLGARFDMEIDALLILVLSVYVARSAGAWVLAIGAARYALAATAWLLPWLRGFAPPRYWRKVVAAIQGVVLTVAAVGVLPRFAAIMALGASLALLSASFGDEVWWLWRHREQAPRMAPAILQAHQAATADLRSNSSSASG